MTRGDGSGVLTQTGLRADLTALGVRPGDIVMVHASLRAVGPVDGGALGLIAALDHAVGTNGTLMMTLGADDSQPFDGVNTPADPDIGVLAEVFRTAPGTVANIHPEGRFGARGARAQELVDDPPWNDYYGPGSALERLMLAGGKVLRLGADLDTVTLLHHAEYLADVADKRRVTRRPRVRDGDRVVTHTITCLDDSNGIVDRPGEEDYFATITRAAIDAGLAMVGHVGHACSELFDAARLVAFGAAWMEQHLV